MKKISRAVIALSVPLIFVIKFIPLSLTLLLVIVSYLLFTVEKVRKDEIKDERFRYFTYAALYGMVFLLIFFFFYLHELPLYFEK